MDKKRSCFQLRSTSQVEGWMMMIPDRGLLDDSDILVTHSTALLICRVQPLCHTAVYLVAHIDLGRTGLYPSSSCGSTVR